MIHRDLAKELVKTMAAYPVVTLLPTSSASANPNLKQNRPF